MAAKSLDKNQWRVLQILEKQKWLTVSRTTKDGSNWCATRQYDAAIALIDLGRAAKVEEFTLPCFGFILELLTIQLAE